MSVVLCLTCVKAVVGVVCGPSGGATAEDGAPAGRWRRRRPAGTRLIRGRRHWLPPPYKYRLPLRRRRRAARQTPAGGGQERAGQQVDTATQDWTGLFPDISSPPPPVGNQWRRDARVRSYLWSPPWIPGRAWSARSWWWETASAGRPPCFTCSPRTASPRWEPGIYTPIWWTNMSSFTADPRHRCVHMTKDRMC